MIIGQGTAKLWPVKNGGLKKLPYLPLVYVVKWGSSQSWVKSFLDFQLWKVTVLQPHDLQLEPSVPSRFEFYAMIWGYFDLLEITLKVMLLPWASGSKQIWMRSFKWGTVCSCRSNGCKVASLQSLQSKKCWDILGSRLHFSRVYVVNRCSSGGPSSIPGHCKLWGPTIL